jgi:hypothetical protein
LTPRWSSRCPPVKQTNKQNLSASESKVKKGDIGTEEDKKDMKEEDMKDKKEDMNDHDMSQQCQSGTPSRLCKTTYNTTAPMYGVSLTSGKPVTIVQKFPDLLQQVIFETCK